MRPGQQARVSLAGVKREEYGYIIGKVNWMSPYPASTADMTEKLKNDQLVRAFMAYGPVFEARVCLDRDPKNTANPFRWSSSRGPEASDRRRNAGYRVDRERGAEALHVRDSRHQAGDEVLRPQ